MWRSRLAASTPTPGNKLREGTSSRTLPRRKRDISRPPSPHGHRAESVTNHPQSSSRHHLAHHPQLGVSPLPLVGRGSDAAIHLQTAGATTARTRAPAAAAMRRKSAGKTIVDHLDHLVDETLPAMGVTEEDVDVLNVVATTTSNSFSWDRSPPARITSQTCVRRQEFSAMASAMPLRRRGG